MLVVVDVLNAEKIKLPSDPLRKLSRSATKKRGKVTCDLVLTTRLDA